MRHRETATDIYQVYLNEFGKGYRSLRGKVKLQKLTTRLTRDEFADSTMIKS